MRLHAYQPSDLPAVLNLLQIGLSAHTVTESALVLKVLLDPDFDPLGAIVAKMPGDDVARLSSFNYPQDKEGR